MKRILIFSLLTLFLTPFFAFAQTSPSSLFTLTTTPPNPAPGQQVIVTAEQTTSADITNANFVWSLDGSVVQQGVGKGFYSFKNRVSGTTNISVTMTLGSGEEDTQELSFTSVGFTVLWQADTYTPPFYKGKAMMASGAKMHVTILPDISNTSDAVDADSLMYSWKKDGSSSPDLSGIGEKTFSFLEPKSGGSVTASVEISSLDNTVNRTFNLKLSPGKPFVLLYQDHPLLGMWYNTPFGDSVDLTEKELSLVAESYFSPINTTGQSNLSYVWSIDGKDRQNSTGDMTIRNESGAQRDSQINLTVQNADQTLKAIQSLLVHFNVDNSSTQTSL